METGKASPTKAQNARKHFTDAAKYYLLAAEAYPKDDERHISGYFLIAISSSFQRMTSALQHFLL